MITTVNREFYSLRPNPTYNNLYLGVGNVAEEPIIRFENVTNRYGDDEPVLKNVSFEIEKGRFYTLLGPSGCGKTTILRLIAGFIEPTEGTIYFNGKKINHVPPNERQVNTVFQD